MQAMLIGMTTAGIVMTSELTKYSLRFVVPPKSARS